MDIVILLPATYPGDYESSEMIPKSYEQIGYMIIQEIIVELWI